MSAGSRKGTLVFGLILIFIGLAFFLSNWFSTLTAWQMLARYWPVLLILIGAKKLYCHFTWQEEPAAEPAPKRRRGCRPSLMAGLLWTLLGALFLLKNLGFGPDLWPIARRYWPVLLILLGLGKLIDYYRRKEGVSIRFGEAFGVLIIIFIGLAITQIPHTAVRDILSVPFSFGDTDIMFGNMHEYTQDFTYPVPAGMPVRIENSNGAVIVTPGNDGEVRIHLRKKIFEDDENRSNQIAGQIKVEGGEEGKAEAVAFVIRTNRDDLSGRNYQFKTDLEILVPRKVQLEIRNSFGGVNVSGLDSKLNVQSSHMLLEMHDCSGDFTVANSYGESRLTNLTGNLKVTVRGTLVVENVKGDVDIRDEYSSVRVSDITGKLTVANEEGSITVDKVTQPVVINGRGSSVTASNLQADVQITNSHKRVRISDANANVKLTSQYATVSLKNIKGNVDLESNSGSATLEEIGGYLKATGQGTYVNANTVSGPIDIVTTLKDVIVTNFSRSCKVNNERGDVSLSTASLGKDAIEVRNRFGDITLILPPNSLFLMDATTRNGRIRSDFIGTESVLQSGDVMTLKYGKPGGPRILLETENNDIFVRARELERSGKRNRQEPEARRR